MKYCTIILTLTILSLIPLTLTAESLHSPEPEAGFFGSIMLGSGMWRGQPSLLDASESNKRINSLEDTAKKKNEVIPMFDFQAGYIAEDTGTWISTHLSDSLSLMEDGIIPSVTVGQYLEELGSVSLSVSRHKLDIWKDPYLVGADRQKTVETDLSVELTYENILTLPVSLSLSYTKTDIKDDIAGKNNPTLARNGTIYTSELVFPLLFFKHNSIMGEISYSSGDIDGKSNRYDGYSFSLIHELDMKSWSISSSFTIDRKIYDGIHPVFNKTRKEDEHTFMTEYIRHDPFGYKNWFVNVNGIISDTDPNIKFFERSDMIVGAGVGYIF